MSVTKDDVRRIARLARIAESEARLETLTGELNGILKWIDQLNEVDVTGVEPMTTPVKFALPMRDDVVADGGVRDKVLANAPKTEEGFFVVPKAVE
ncbi:MAG: Asp-tRNA(Asn)/Glu-tRNA(Gln) amidotransferase subunit GatC [Maricaulaceae bacterium]|nr:Asp-tRNA(Asn)/Glu-tRNA(Gln) amidotransferase subunit GatC [Maricaulaceae bacterium]